VLKELPQLWPQAHWQWRTRHRCACDRRTCHRPSECPPSETRNLHFGEAEIDELKVKRFHVGEIATENAEQTAENLRDD
jgi:hypothetical protein